MRIVLIIVDTLRHDHFSFAGHPFCQTPEIDELASHSNVFTNDYIASFPTLPNREDTASGRYTFPHHGWGPLPSDVTTLASVMTKHGYTTQLIGDTPHLFHDGRSYNRGFQAYNWIRGNECDIYTTRYNKPFPKIMPFKKTRTDSLPFGHPLVELHHWLNPDIAWEHDYFAARTAAAASRWIEENYKAENFFLWVDTFECHEPWSAPPYFVERVDPGYKGFPVVYPVYGPADCYTPAELKNMQAQYIGEVMLATKWMGAILRKLKDVGIYDDTMVIFTTDHGTYVGDHNRAGKMYVDYVGGAKKKVELPWPHYEGVTKIPLIVKMPGQTKKRVVSELAQPVDIFPTLLDLAGIREDDLPLQGHSWGPLLQGEKVKWPRQYAFSSPAILEEEPNYWTTITGKGWTLSLGGAAKEKPLLFNLRKDPGQETNVFEDHKDVVREMGRNYLEFLGQCGAAPGKIALFEKKLKRFSG